MTIFMVMKSVSIAEIKTHAPRVIREVEAGEQYTITRRNRPVARLISCGTAKNKTRPGFDPGVVIKGDLTEPSLDASEWGDLLAE